MNLRNLMIWGLFVAVLLTLFYSVMNPAGGRGGQSAGELTYSQLQQKTDANQVAKAVVRGEQVMVEDKDSRRFTTILPLGGTADILKRFEDHGVNVQAQSTQPSPWMQLLGALLPFILLGALWFFFMRQAMNGAGRGAMGFGKSKAKLLTENKTRVTFEDVAGVDEAKEELAEIVEFLKEPAKFQRLGGKIPKGALLVGPPGTGKTLLARAVAGEAGVPVFSISGSAVGEVFVGVGARRVRAGDIGAAIAYEDGPLEIQRKVASGPQQHPRTGLAILVLPLPLSQAVLGVVGAVVNGIERRTLGTEFLAHPPHQVRELFLAVESARDTRLIGDDHKLVTLLLRRTGQGKDALDPADVFRPVQVADLLVDDAVPIKKQRRIEGLTQTA